MLSDKTQFPSEKMSVPLHMFSALDRPYNHYKHIKSEIRDAKGMLEQVRRGIYDHGRLFPRDNENRRYLDSFARQILYLEGEVDSWKLWASRMPPQMARKEVNILRNQIFRLMVKMGPAAEAQHYAVFPVWNPPRATTPWRQISLTKVRKFKRAAEKARKQNRETRAEVLATKKELETMKMDNLCLQFKSLKL